MIVALGTFHGNSKDPFAKGVGFVQHIFHPVLFFNDATFFRVFVISIEGSSQDLLFGWIGQKVACELPGQKLIVGQVFIEGMNHPISVGPLASNVVVLVAIAIGVAGDIQPENSHFFSVSGAIEQLI